jgi:hypothetical protein
MSGTRTTTLRFGWASRLRSSKLFATVSVLPRWKKDVEAVYNFAAEFMRDRNVSDATLQAAKNVLGGDRGVVDLVGTMALVPALLNDGVAGSDAARGGEPNPTSTDWSITFADPLKRLCTSSIQLVTRVMVVVGGSGASGAAFTIRNLPSLATSLIAAWGR